MKAIVVPRRGAIESKTKSEAPCANSSPQVGFESRSNRLRWNSLVFPLAIAAGSIHTQVRLIQSAADCFDIDVSGLTRECTEPSE